MMQTNIAAKLYPSDRATDRIVVNRPSTLRDHTGAPLDVVIENISEGGCRLRCDRAMDVEGDIRIGIAGIGIRHAQVIWNEGDILGCAFDNPLSQSDVASTLQAVTLLQGQFGGPDIMPASQLRPMPELALRTKFLILIVAAAIAWLPFIALAKLIRALI